MPVNDFVCSRQSARFSQEMPKRLLFFGFQSLSSTSCDGSRAGKGRRTIASKQEKSVVLVAMPSDRQRTAITVNVGFARRVLAAYRISCSKASMLVSIGWGRGPYGGFVP